MSFAAFFSIKKGNEQVLTVGDLAITFCDDSSCESGYTNIGQVIGTSNGELRSVFPYSSDSEALSSTPYIFNVKNSGSVRNYLTIKLVEDATFTPSGDYADYESVTTNYASHLKVGIGECPNGLVNFDDVSVYIYSDLVDDKILSDVNFLSEQKKMYCLWTWLDKTTPNDIQKKYFVANLEFEAEFKPLICNANYPMDSLGYRILYDSNCGVADNINSTYVNNSVPGIDFSKISSNSNGKGLYYISENTEDNRISYYFRGDVTNNYVKFGKEEKCEYKGLDVVYLNNLETLETVKPTGEQCLSSNVCYGSWLFSLLFNFSGVVGLDETSCNISLNMLFNQYVGENKSTCLYNDEPVAEIQVDENGSLSKMSFELTEEKCTSTNICVVNIDGNVNAYGVGLNSEECKIFSGYLIDEKAVFQDFNPYTGEAASYIQDELRLWRVVRINEDGNIRLITEDPVGQSSFSEGDQDNAYFGYMYGELGSDSYEGAHANVNNSLIKTFLDEWYYENLSNYSKYIADSGFCNDRSVISGLGYAQNTTYYGPYNRIVNLKKTQFKCPNISNDLFTTTNALKGNQALNYPIGLLTADEASYAGMLNFRQHTSGNMDMYLRNNTYFWTMSPSIFELEGNASGADGWYIRSSINADNDMNAQNINASYYVRPVINISSGLKVTSGNGTFENPYIIGVD